MNRIKTFIYYSGAILLAHIAVRLLIWFSNRVFDNIPDLLYVSTLGAAVGYLPFIFAAQVALNTTSNYEGTRKILWIWKILLASVFIFLGIADFFLYDTEYLFNPLLLSEEGINTNAPDPWLYNLPNGITGLIAAIQVKNDKIPLNY